MGDWSALPMYLMPANRSRAWGGVVFMFYRNENKVPVPGGCGGDVFLFLRVPFCLFLFETGFTPLYVVCHREFLEEAKF